jgi:hypothetical protein
MSHLQNPTGNAIRDLYVLQAISLADAAPVILSSVPPSGQLCFLLGNLGVQKRAHPGGDSLAGWALRFFQHRLHEGCRRFEQRFLAPSQSGYVELHFFTALFWAAIFPEKNERICSATVSRADILSLFTSNVGIKSAGDFADRGGAKLWFTMHAATMPANNSLCSLACSIRSRSHLTSTCNWRGVSFQN